MIYDSASVITPQDSISALGTAVPGVFSSYQDVNAAALAALDSAIVYANAANGRPSTESGNFPLPGTWINGYTPTAVEFIKLIRSWKAKFRASVARTPQERAAVDWDAVIADAQNGITADWKVTTNTVTGPGFGALGSHYQYGTWHQMTPFIMGMADTSGSYTTWVGQSLDARGAGAIPFFMKTPDQRFPQGADRTAQQNDLTLNNTKIAGNVPKRYFVNRNTSDPTGTSWGRSQYDHVRFSAWNFAGSVAGGTAGNGPFPFFTLAELNMLQAEGLLRKGNVSAAVALINQTRASCGFGGVPAGCTPRPTGNGDVATGYTAPIGGGLPAIPTSIVFGGIGTNGVTTRVAGDDVPGGSVCVPRIPVGASISGGGTTRCGNVWEAMKYEKRIETIYAGFANWYFDERGWGDLPLATPLSWSPPWEELTTRFWTGPQIAAYGQGGPFPSGGAALSTYGW
jgi:hypothetical protein